MGLLYINERFAVIKVIHLNSIFGYSKCPGVYIGCYKYKSLENMCSPCAVNAFDVILPILCTVNGIYMWLFYFYTFYWNDNFVKITSMLDIFGPFSKVLFQKTQKNFIGFQFWFFFSKFHQKILNISRTTSARTFQ